MAGHGADQYVDARADRDAGAIKDEQWQPKPAPQFRGQLDCQAMQLF